MTMRAKLCEYIEKKYGAAPEHPWLRFPGYVVFRHEDNRKWFALLMDISREKLGGGDGRIVDVLNVKLTDPLLADLLIRQPGYFPGYHISRGNWVSILLDGTVPYEDVCRWVDESYMATASGGRRQQLRAPKEWLIPANPKYFDILHAFDTAEEIRWKQGAGIRTGDTVYMYVAAPASAILYRCEVTETDIPAARQGGRLNLKSLMRIRLLKRYPAGRFSFEVLRTQYGILAVRGPRGIPQRLSEDLRGE